MGQERISFLALHFTPGIGDFLVKQLISYCGSAEQVFKTTRGKLLKIPGVGEVSALAIINGDCFTEAERELKKAEKEGAARALFSARTPLKSAGVGTPVRDSLT